MLSNTSLQGSDIFALDDESEVRQYDGVVRIARLHAEIIKQVSASLSSAAHSPHGRLKSVASSEIVRII
jgi:hypothetical protein